MMFLDRSPADRIGGWWQSSRNSATSPNATRFERLSHLEAIQRRLQVMDSTALSLCREHELPIVVFDVRAQDSIYRALNGERIGTTVSAGALTEPAHPG